MGLNANVVREKRSVALILAALTAATVLGVVLVVDAPPKLSSSLTAAEPLPSLLPSGTGVPGLDCDYREPAERLVVYFAGQPYNDYDPDPARRTIRTTAVQAAAYTAKNHVKRYTSVVDEGGGSFRVYDGDKRIAHLVVHHVDELGDEYRGGVDSHNLATSKRDGGSYATTEIAVCDKSQVPRYDDPYYDDDPEHRARRLRRQQAQ